MALKKSLLRVILIGLLLGACGTTAQPQVDISQRLINITATVGMIADIARNVGGERVQVTALMGPGVDPHLYKPSYSDVRRLEEADIIFYGGLDLEGRMTDLFEKIERNGKPTVAVSEDIPDSRLRKPIEFEGKYDPHIWFDVTLWEYAVQTITEHLTELDPSSADYYQANTDAYLAQLDELNQYVHTQIDSIPPQSRVLITAHDAFGYFGDQYGMEVRGLQGTSTATEAGAGDVQALAAFIAERQIKAIFVESSVPQATVEAVQAAVQARGWDVKIGGELFSDAMGQDGSPEGTYIGMVKHNVDIIVSALK
jgi:manganese/zinc/iron transport system substrate-binding protein